MGLMKTMAQSSAELKAILDRLEKLESGESFVTNEQFTAMSETVNNMNTTIQNIENGENIENIMLANYPVGSIYLSVNSTDPTELFGGTWVAWGAGRVPVGVGMGTDANNVQRGFNTVESTGGEYTHKLTVDEIPNHRHDFNALWNFTMMNASSGQGVVSPSPNETAGYTGYTGGDTYHNNIQPYITCYMWKRTA